MLYPVQTKTPPLAENKEVMTENVTPVHPTSDEVIDPETTKTSSVRLKDSGYSDEAGASSGADFRLNHQDTTSPDSGATTLRPDYTSADEASAAGGVARPKYNNGLPPMAEAEQYDVIRERPQLISSEFNGDK